MRILIADDHSIVRRGIKDILRDEFPFAEIVEVGDAAALMLKIIKESWDIVISDLSMPGRTALDVLPEIRQQAPNLPVLILSIYPEEQYAIRVLKAGAAGYLNKDLAPEELINAVRRVISGRKYITPSVAEKLADFSGQPKPAHEQLSDREFEVMKLLAAGKSVSEIGSLFHLSATTISTYRARILKKMNMKTNADLIQYAITHQLI
ncbi:response regulator [Flavisolibacter nicotianae]|uniref:response regulator n=1 Tax=Flavisolibacter nicotianae TaxID=2364882 RepID=UPI000EB3479B|nr:response regulator transcription factor [Flavisolibacter nicotianae]